MKLSFAQSLNILERRSCQHLMLLAEIQVHHLLQMAEQRPEITVIRSHHYTLHHVIWTAGSPGKSTTVPLTLATLVECRLLFWDMSAVSFLEAEQEKVIREET